MQGPPIPLNRFVGRERELADVAVLLASERLVTLTGSGGSGKTRLAIEAAGRVADAAAGDVVWVDLSAVAAADMVAPRVAAALRIADLPGHSPEASLQDALGSRPAVIVLDCCEHLVGACARLAGLLLRTCAPLRILATSREPLGVEGERVYPVPPLSLPGAGDGGSGTDAVATSEAVRLFVERARAVLPSFALSDANASPIARICLRLDGIPLAIELAAARMRVLTPHQLAERLDDLFNVLTGGARDALPRHRTLRAAMDWSYELLADAERRLLERLSVFAGGFTLEAAEEVAPGDGVEPRDVLDLLAALVEKSLVTMRERHGTARYGLLEIVRQYALERLRGEGGEDRARMRHARWLVALLEGESLALMRAEPGALDRVAAEGDNIRAALDWCEGASVEVVELGLRLASGIWPFWFFRAQRQDGRRRLEGLLARCDSEPTRARAAALHGAGMLAWWLGDAEEARRHLDASVDAWRSLADEPWLVLALAHSAQPLHDLGEEDAALVRAEEAAVLARASGDPWLLAFSHCTGLGYVRSRRGEFEEADGIFAEVEGLVEAGDHPWPLGVARYGRAVGAWQQGDLPRAERHGRAALEPLLAYGDPLMAARAILVLAYVEGERSAFERAGLLLGVAEALTASVGGRLLAMDMPRVERLRARVREAMGTAAADAARERGRAMDLSCALAFAAPGSEGSTQESEVSTPGGEDPPPVGNIAGSTPPDLQVLALGPLRIFRGGTQLEPVAFGSSKPRELLLFLLSDPRGRTREEVGSALWPEASAAQVRNSFHVTLHRLRKTLGDAEWIEHDGERYRLATGRVATLDGIRFEHEVTRALRRLRAGGGDPDAVALRDALALYQGDFLEGEIVGSWAWEPRDRWKALCVEGLSELASWLAARGRDDEAAAAFRTLLQREDLSEDAYRGLMTIHARRGEEDEALRLHRQLRLLLREELDTEPEPATEALARRIETRQPV